MNNGSTRPSGIALSPLPPDFPKSLVVVAFDCDGVILDSKAANIRFYNHILERFGFRPMRKDQEEFAHMHSIKDSLAFLMDNDADVLGRAWAYCEQVDFSEFNRYLCLEPYLRETLANLRLKYRIALATNRTVSTHMVLAHFRVEHFFDLIVTASDVSHPKPHPEIMEKILNTYAVRPDQVLFVGDSSVDRDLAVNSGVLFAPYKNSRLDGHFPLQDFLQLQRLLSCTGAGTETGK